MSGQDATIDDAMRQAYAIARKSIDIRVCCEKLPPCRVEQWCRLLTVDITAALRERDAEIERLKQASRKALMLLLDDFFTPAEAVTWFNSEQPMLGGISPATAITAGRTGDVIAIIAQLRDGSYT